MNWDEFFFRIADVVAQKSKDRSTKIGAVIVGHKHEIVSVGYNGFPRRAWDHVEGRHERPVKYLWTEHAERNAIYNAALNGIRLRGKIIHLSCGLPCAECARAIIQSGINEVVIKSGVWNEQKADERWSKQWRESCEVGRVMFTEAGVSVRFVD